MQIAHLSDVHVIWAPGRRAPWYRFLNKRVAGGLNLLLKRTHSVEILEAAVADLAQDPPDHLVVTGDLTNLSLEAEFERALAVLSAAGLGPEQVSLIPGNHDTYTRASYRARTFERIMAPLLGAEDMRWPRAQRIGEVLIVSTTSSVPTPWFSAYGRMGSAQLDEVRALLAGSDAGFKVVLVHHPPLQADGEPDIVWRRNLDGGALVAVCHEAGVNLILCGHTHKRFEHVTSQGLRIVCAGSTTQPPAVLGQRATYNRYTVEGGRLTGLETRALDPATQRFVSFEVREV